MNRKLLYTLSLIGFFLMWGVFGFAAATPRNEPSLYNVAPFLASTAADPDAAVEPAIQVTGAQTSTQLTVFYMLIGVGLLIAVLALRNAAKQPTTTYVRHKNTPDQS